MSDVHDSTLPELKGLSDFLTEKIECLASGSQDLRALALTAAKRIFDISIQSEHTSIPHISNLLASLDPSKAPQTRSQAKVEKDKPMSHINVGLALTPLSSLFVENMDDEQIWAQLDLRTKAVCSLLEFALEGETGDEDVGGSDSDTDARLRKVMGNLEASESLDFEALTKDMGVDDDDSTDDSEDEDSEDEDSEDEDSEEYEEEGQGELSDDDLGEAVVGLHDSSSDRDEEINDARRHKKPRKATSELDDGFFDLSTFNAETEQAEARSSSKGRLGVDSDSDSEMSVDLFAPVDEANLYQDDLEDDSHTILYKDFFEPPGRVASSSKGKVKSTYNANRDQPMKHGKVRFHEEVRVKRIRPKGKNLPLRTLDDDDDDEEDDDTFDIRFDGDELGVDGEDSQESDDEDDSEDDPSGRQVIERLKSDLFAEENDEDTRDMTTYQKRLAALREEIAELEAQNVGKKDWTLMGEAGSRARPQNSLLEEDLDFDRVMKAVPVITEEVVQGLEERIKARILENNFDDVVRIRPRENKPFLPSRFLELQDTKSTQSLAQIYENDYVASQTEGTATDDRDGKLKKEHEEIDKLWENICGKLDALCNAHYIPKQPKATISSVSNISTTTLESALPTTKSTTTLLAPEEVFSPLSSEPRARSELTPTEKRALRGKERKMRKKQRDALDTSVDKFARLKSIGGIKKQKQAALESVVKHGKGVTVVGKGNKNVGNKKDRKIRT